MIDIDYSSSIGWDTQVYASDKVTILNDTDADGIIDVGSVGPYGDTEVIFVEVDVPVNATDGDTEIMILDANSSLDNSIYDSATINTIARILVTYKNSARGQEQIIFEAGKTVYARAHGLEANNVYYQWVASNGTVYKVSPDIAVTSENDADDQFTTDDTMPVGNWTIIVFDSPGPIAPRIHLTSPCETCI